MASILSWRSRKAQLKNILPYECAVALIEKASEKYNLFQRQEDKGKGHIMMASYYKEGGAIDDNRNKMANHRTLFQSEKFHARVAFSKLKHPLQKLLLNSSNWMTKQKPSV